MGKIVPPSRTTGLLLDLRHLASAGAVSVAIRLWRSAPRVETVFQAQGPGSRQRPGAERSERGRW